MATQPPPAAVDRAAKAPTAAQQQPPLRQIRAHQDADTVTVYQAYSRAIADPAVAAQKLHASEQFRHTRMTWIKPSWAWMLYRAGYSYKDHGQERILALRMKKDDFVKVLEMGVLTTHGTPPAGEAKGKERGAKDDAEVEGEEKDGKGLAANDAGKRRRKHRDPDKPKSADVKIQWDPERTVRLERLEYRSIQIGIPAAVSPKWTEEWIVSIEDVTDKARELKRVLDEEPDVTDAELRERGLVPEETPFEVSTELQKSLRMV